MKCYRCGKETLIVCANCKKPICNKHARIVKRTPYCEMCVYDVRKKGLIIVWTMLAALLVAAWYVFTHL